MVRPRAGAEEEISRISVRSEGSSFQGAPRLEMVLGLSVIAHAFNYFDFRCSKDRRKSSTGSGRSKLSSTGDIEETNDIPMSPHTPHSPQPVPEQVRAAILEQDVADASDEDQMVICEESPQEIDLKCKEKVTDSDSESHSDLDNALENRSAFQQQCYNSPDITCRPEPIKAKLTNDSGPKYSPVATSSVLNYPYHTPINPQGVSEFKPTGGAFKTMASPKVIKTEVKTENQESPHIWNNGPFVINSKVENLASPAFSLSNSETNWINTTVKSTAVSTKTATPTLAILKSQVKTK